jgi:hypothetical protein
MGLNFNDVNGPRLFFDCQTMGLRRRRSSSVKSKTSGLLVRFPLNEQENATDSLEIDQFYRFQNGVLIDDPAQEGDDDYQQQIENEVMTFLRMSNEVSARRPQLRESTRAISPLSLNITSSESPSSSSDSDDESMSEFNSEDDGNVGRFEREDGVCSASDDDCISSDNSLFEISKKQNQAAAFKRYLKEIELKQNYLL